MEGAKLVNELLQSDYTIRKLYAVAEWSDAYKGSVPVQTVTADELQKMSTQPSPNQVIAVAEQRATTGEPVTAGRFTLVLDGIQDPGNFGTIIRIADWFGIQQVVASEDTVELYNPKVIQSTMGSFIRVNVWYRALAPFLESVKEPVYGALLDGKNMYNEPAVTEGLLLIGNESKGISRELLPFISHPVTIPRLGGAESLNAAVATGIIVSHLKKG